MRFTGRPPVLSSPATGMANPAYLETENLILVIEGKRTEREPATPTTRMPERSQMLRPMDAAYGRAGNKKIPGTMIVEGSGGADAVTPGEF